MPRVHIELDKRAVIAPVRYRTFGAFVEHLGRCVYTGLYEPGHPTANEDGVRMDVVELVQELGTATVRYPGGNFVSGFRWEDSVGPRDKRPVRRDLGWHSLEPNQVGLDEFARWLKLTGAELMLAVNLGTRGILPALDLLEYANHPSGTALSNLRIANGTPQPHNVRQMQLSFDEWNVWYLKDHQEAAEVSDEWSYAPRLLEDVYTVADAVVVGNLLMTLLKHSDRVTSASLAQLVNVIAPIMTEPGGPAWRQATFFPFAITSRLASGEVIRPVIEGPTYGTARHGEASVIDSVATVNDGRAAVFLVNRDLKETARVTIDVRSLASTQITEAVTLANADVYAKNTLADQERVKPAANASAALTDGVLTIELPPVSWTAAALC